MFPNEIIACPLLCLASFIQRYACEVHPYCYIYQYLVPFLFLFCTVMQFENVLYFIHLIRY